MKRIVLFSASFLVMMVSMCIVMMFAQDRDSFYYVGAGKCEECHGEDSIGNQCKIWRSTGHSKAYELLNSEAAKQIALKASVKDLQRDYACLQCHTTGGGKAAITKTEGVGCEACHGPGSAYYEMGNHVDYSDPTMVTGYMRAIQHGMHPILGIVGKHLKNREKVCVGCHTAERPCVPEDAKIRFKKKMTIQVVDKLQRGTVILKHPIHR